MRKWMIIFLAMLMFVSLLTGCPENRPLQTQPTEQTTAAPAPTEATKPSKPSKDDKTSETTEAPTEPALSEMDVIQANLHEETALCAVAYVGNCGGSFADVQDGFVATGITEDLPMVAEVKEDRFFTNDGSELYLIIPRNDVGLTVYEQYVDNESGELACGEMLYSSDQCEPILLRGNISDIFSNFLLVIAGNGGETLEYSPQLSMMDGTVWIDTELIYDLTPYETLGIVPDSGFDTGASCMGSWYAEASNADGETMILELILGYNGEAAYGYGPAGSEFIEFFEGSWHENDGKLVLELSGGSYDAEPYSIYAAYEFVCEEQTLTLTHSDGDGLTNSDTITFTSANSHALIGLWTTSEYDFEGDTYTYYDIELMGDDKCNLLIHNGEGTTFAAYEGSWSFAENELSFYMQSYLNDADMEENIGGVYRAKIDADGWLTLTNVSGYNFTELMSECGVQVFEPTVSYG